MRVVVFEAEDWEREACLRLSPPHAVDCRAEALTAADAAAHADAEAIATFIKSELTAPVLRRLPRLQLIATRSTGYDHIDLDYCKAQGITVCNVPGYGDHTVAEHAFALLLAVSRRVVEAAERTRRGDFSEAGLRGFDLHGKTLGVVGTGRIGRCAAGIGRGFGMRVLGFDVRPDPELEAQGLRYVALADLLAEADVVTLHVPGGEGTKNLLSDAQFARMKPGAVLINTARGGVVDAEALVRALAGGRLAGAGLDVLTEEAGLREEAEIFRAGAALPIERLRGLLADHALLRFPTVVLTPHIAYDTREAVGRILDTTVANIEAFASGRPINVVVAPA
ncbi:hydroxyacid dehydrogenase [Caulobacter sp. 17J80-11]|uniref:hydroxyacid dehydrogenase n=1 Tax=Caulobacter sp. 17J80-11 TaxID=2763502 RepID=UPI0016535166|nr:hydroxyacid dehydrogenase [Caulobacter sp. 17J80-11]MBC6981233.1 hydroxyacid dehydrogenase [Caulobacter sp. 17J80-11]